MQRIIKFRVWNKDHKEWEKHALGMGTDGKLITNHNEDFELCQFTGLLDRDGKEIFEGDIVIYAESKSYYEICEDRGAFLICVNEEVGVGNERHCRKTNIMLLRNATLNEIEVIGNVWENPTIMKV